MGDATVCSGVGGAGALHRGDWPELLFDVAAVLTTSTALSSVAEAFGVHEIQRFATAQSTSENIPAQLSLTLITVAVPQSDAVGDLAPLEVPVALPPEPFVGPEPDTGSLASVAINSVAINPATSSIAISGTSVSPATDSVQATRLLTQIALLPGGEIAAFVRNNPAAIQSLLVNPPQARDVSLWWASMSYDSRNALRTAAPQLVGNLDGVPYATRDLANRSVLTTTMRELESTIASELGRTAVEKAKLQLSMLKSIANAVGDASGNTNRTLLSLDTAGQGRAAIIVGDLTTADYITYMVPGMFFTIEGQMVYWTDAAARLRDEQLSWLAHFGDTTSTVATVAWIGYHTPNLTNVASLENAEEGRDSLARAIEGLQMLRGTDQPYVSIIGHSYGSTAALMALTEYDFEIDALAVVGSPGSAAQSVDELNVKNGNVFVGKAQWDPVPNSAAFGSEPGAEKYGATVFGTDGGVDPLTSRELLRSFFHIEYFSPGTESLRNLALIGVGHGDAITPQ